MTDHVSAFLIDLEFLKTEPLLVQQKARGPMTEAACGLVHPPPRLRGISDGLPGDDTGARDVRSGCLWESF